MLGISTLGPGQTTQFFLVSFGGSVFLWSSKTNIDEKRLKNVILETEFNKEEKNLELIFWDRKIAILIYSKTHLGS